MAHLVIVRSLPGGGKTTFAQKAYPHYEHLETDKLFIKDGVYKFDPSMLGKYHECVRIEAKRLLDAGMNVIVSNTFTQVWEMQPYLDMTTNVTVYHVNPHKDALECAAWNTHMVPYDTIRKMEKRWERYDGEYYITTW